MKFGPVALRDAMGAVLAHSVSLPDRRLGKGSRLGPSEIDALRSAGCDEVIVARLAPEDIGEDDAALRLARSLVPDPGQAGLRLGQAATGRVNIMATAPGIVEIVTERIHALNAVHPMITVATVAPFARMSERAMVATVKIISYGVPETALEAACHAGRSSLCLRPVICRSAELIQTCIDGGERLPQKGHEVTAARLARMGVSLAPMHLVPHEQEPLARAIAQSRADIVLILTGSATSDARDVAPEALRSAGGKVIHFGMPVDPGNLLFFGEIGCGSGARPVIGLPGCARAPARNGADWVIERLLCGLPLGPADIAQMGVGGLLKEIAERGRLREA